MYKKRRKLLFSVSIPVFVRTGATHNDGTDSDVTINRPSTTGATTNRIFHLQSSLTMQLASNDMPLNKWYYELCKTDAMKDIYIYNIYNIYIYI